MVIVVGKETRGCGSRRRTVYARVHIVLRMVEAGGMVHGESCQQQTIGAGVHDVSKYKYVR